MTGQLAMDAVASSREDAHATTVGGDLLFISNCMSGCRCVSSALRTRFVSGCSRWQYRDGLHGGLVKSWDPAEPAQPGPTGE